MIPRGACARLFLILAAMTALGSNAFADEKPLVRCPTGFAALAEKIKTWLGKTDTLITDGASEHTPVDIFSKLQKKKLFLEQNADYLRADTCGGTCASVSIVNNMLVMSETLAPGSITKLSGREIRKLHQKLVDEFIGELKSEHGINGTNGAHLEQFKDIYPRVFKKVFKSNLADDVSVRELGQTGFQSVTPGPQTLLVLSVDAGKGNHAVVVTGIRPTAEKRTRENNFPEDFIVTISDPHAPGKFKELKVYERDWRLFLEGYGGGRELTVETYGQRFQVTGGQINTSVAINFRRAVATKTWTDESVRRLIDPVRGSYNADVFLKDGTVLKNVALMESREPGRIFFFERFMLQRNLSRDDVADIKPTEVAEK